MSGNASHQGTAPLRVCGCCEWIFNRRPLQPNGENGTECPKDGLPSYGAHWVYGPKCYRFKRTQEPWLKRKVDAYAKQLRQEIGAANAARDPADLFHKP